MGADGRRRSLRLGVVTKRVAETTLRHVEYIIFSQRSGEAVPTDTADWLKTRPDAMRKRLARVGLIRGYKPRVGSLGAFLAAYVESRGDVKPATATVYGHTRRNLTEFFGADKPLADITYADAARFRGWLQTDQELQEATVRRRCSLARQFFEFAVDDREISENPFKKLKGIGVKSNRSRDFFVSPEAAAKILDACPNAEWRLIFALARWGGLRTPSETLALRWVDVDWTASRVKVRSPKTERHGKAFRVIPLFPELRPWLEDCFNPEAEYVITRYREPTQNLGSQMVRIIRRAGVEPWPKTFQNMRSTRETELAEAYPIHVVCEWIGNSQAVAKKHYLQVTEDHFAKAAQKKKKKKKNGAPCVGGAGRTRAGAGEKSKRPEKTRTSRRSRKKKWAAQG